MKFTTAFASVAALAAMLLGGQAGQPAIRTVDTTAQMGAAFASVISADVDSTVKLPDGNMLWITGDITKANGQVMTGSFPHSGFVTQAPGKAAFTVLSGPYGQGYQQVPDWTDGTFFWAAAGVVDNGWLYVFGSRIQATGPGPFDFTVIGNYMARFSLPALTYQDIASVPAPVSSVTFGNTGWWLYYSQVTGTPPCYSNCFTGSAYWVPTGDIGTVADWSSRPGIFPSTLDSGCPSGACGIGNVVSVVHEGTSKWVAIVKEDDILGANLLRLTSAKPEGPWTVAEYISAPPQVSGDCTYSAQLHPGEGEPSGWYLATYAENSCGNNSAPYYDPTFLLVSG